MTEQEVYEDLKTKVGQLLDDVKKDAMEKLDTLQRSGAGLLDDHERNGMSFETPKAFMAYLCGRDKVCLHEISDKGKCQTHQTYFKLQGNDVMNALQLAQILEQLQAYRSYMLSPDCTAEEANKYNLDNLNLISMIRMLLSDMKVEITK